SRTKTKFKTDFLSSFFSVLRPSFIGTIRKCSLSFNCSIFELEKPRFSFSKSMLAFLFFCAADFWLSSQEFTLSISALFEELWRASFWQD
ncbi:MAG: hypothetical protein ACTHOF_15745, partial [Flavisolibacter sp.]